MQKIDREIVLKSDSEKEIKIPICFSNIFFCASKPLWLDTIREEEKWEKVEKVEKLKISPDFDKFVNISRSKQMKLNIDR